MGTLIQGGQLFDGVGSFADSGRRVIRALVSYDDAWNEQLSYLVGQHVRNWTEGQVRFPPPDSVNTWPNWTALPSDSLAAELLPGNPTLHYDFQEMRLSGTRRNRKITAVYFEGGNLPRSVWWGGGYEGTSALFGATLWSDFEITSREGANVVPQYQHAGPGRTERYGGSRDPFTGQVVGAYHTIAGHGCYLADLAMVLAFAGVPMTVPALNDTLQPVEGFEAERVCTVLGVSGQSVADTVTISALPGRKRIGLGAWSDFVIDRGNARHSGALATLTVVDSAHAVILTRPYTSLHIAPGQEAWVYRSVDPRKVVRKLIQPATGALAFIEFRLNQPAAVPVEDALRDSLASLLFVGTRERPHWVLATGIRPVFTGPASARATYAIVDPADSSGLTTLWARNGNRFDGAWVARRTAGPGPNSGAPQGTSDEITLWLTGEANLTVQGPQGIAIAFDPETGTYQTSEESVIAVRSAHPGNALNPASQDVPADMIVLPVTGPGSYSLSVLAEDDGAVSLSASREAGGVQAGQAASGAELDHGGRAYFTLSVNPGAPQPLNLNLVSTVGAASPDIAAGIALRIRPSVARGGTRLALRLPEAGLVRLEVFDVSGRRVRTLRNEVLNEGEHVIEWDGRSAGGGDVGAGLFFIRLSASGRRVVGRFVRLGP